MRSKIFLSLSVLFFITLLTPLLFGPPIKVVASTRLIASPSLADEGYAIDWWTIDGGGGICAGGGYTLQGTIGQPDAGSINGGDYTLDGGFWVKGILDFLEYLIHLPLVLK